VAGRLAERAVREKNETGKVGGDEVWITTATAMGGWGGGGGRELTCGRSAQTPYHWTWRPMCGFERVDSMTIIQTSWSASTTNTKLLKVRAV